MTVVAVSFRTKALEAMLALGTLTVVLVKDTYTFDIAHDYLADVSGGDRVATAAVTTPTVTDGEVFGTIPTFSAVAAGPTISGLWFYVDTGSAATSPLVSWVDRHADGRSISIVPNDGDIDLAWQATRLFGIGSPV